MAVVHMTEAEAARDFEGMLAKARAGEEVRIESGADVFSLGRVTPQRELSETEGQVKPRLLSEIIASIRQRESHALLPEGFGDELNAVIDLHSKERLIDPWESF